MKPEVNSAFRTILIALGAIGVSKGWWSQEGLETTVDHIIVFGGAALVFAGFAWGIWAKRPQSTEAKKIAVAVDDAQAKAE